MEIPLCGYFSEIQTTPWHPHTFPTYLPAPNPPHYMWNGPNASDCIVAADMQFFTDGVKHIGFITRPYIFGSSSIKKAVISYLMGEDVLLVSPLEYLHQVDITYAKCNSYVPN
jgi:hypothetical protein